MTSLLSALASYSAFDTREQLSLDQTMQFLASDSNAFCRSNTHGHVTAGGFVVDGKGHVLLNHHKKSGLWLHIGGHCDGDSDVYRVALREVLEETGLHFDAEDSPSIYNVAVFHVPANAKYGEPPHMHYDVNYLFVTQDTNIVISDESLDLQWVTIDRALQLIDAGDFAIRCMLAKYQQWLVAREGCGTAIDNK